jgi:hypothetical protein
MADLTGQKGHPQPGGYGGKAPGPFTGKEEAAPPVYMAAPPSRTFHVRAESRVFHVEADRTPFFSGVE